MPTIEELDKKYGISTGGRVASPALPSLPSLPASNKISELDKKYGLSGGGRARQPAKPLETSDGLYNLAVQNGLQDRADAILKQQEGEESKKIFSGGFISDIFDVINAAQYGVTGLLKGKSFIEGVRTRQSFTDKDALGDKGLPGVIAGLALDIAVDPLTYIAPWTIIKKVPGAVKLLKIGQEAAFGKMVTKAIDTGIEGIEKSSEVLEGGTKLGKYLGQKFVWMFGQDSVYRKTFERSTLNTALETQKIVELTKSVAKIEPAIAAKLLSKDETGRFIRTSTKDLQKILSPEDFKPVSELYDMIDNMGKEMVDLKLLSKETYKENVGEYIKNAYLEYEQMKGKGLLGIKKLGVKGVKQRVEGLTVEQMEKLGQIDNPAYLLFKTAFDMRKDIENVKLFNKVAEKFGTDVAQAGFKQLPKTSRLFTSSAGEKLEMFKKIKNLNQELKPAFKELKATFKADKKVLDELSSLEKEVGELTGLRAEEFHKFFSEGDTISKTIPGYKSIKGAGRLSENLEDVGRKAEKFENLKELEKSDIGMEIERLFLNGDLERSGFKSKEAFFRYIKNPYSKVEETTKDVIAKGSAEKLVQLQKSIEKLTRRSDNLSDINKSGVNDSFIYLENAINKIRLEKEEIYEQIGKVKLGELSGKYVPENIFDSLQNIVEPFKDSVGKQLVANFKFFKVIMNPGTHARNVVSNTLLNWWKLGLGPWRLDVYTEALKEVKQGGRWTEMAKQQGYNLNNFASSEMKNILESPEALKWGHSLGKGWAIVKQKLGDLYQQEENVAKMAAFIHQSKKGLSPEAAWKAAESATFNYAQVTPFVRKLRESLFGLPFITFTTKATPVVLETMVKAPHRIGAIGKIKQTIENLSDIKETDRERASEPPWIKDGFYVKLPMKDSEGRSAYFDLTYILPFGDLLQGNFFGKNINRETGLRESLSVSALKKSPFISLLTELGKNRDFYGDKVWQESDPLEKQTADLMRHITKTMMPPPIADEIKGGYNSKGERRLKGIRGALKPQDKETQQRTLMQELLRSVGAKVQPINADIQEGFKEFNQKKMLQTLLLENGVLNNLNINYVPKEKQLFP